MAQLSTEMQKLPAFSSNKHELLLLIVIMVSQHIMLYNKRITRNSDESDVCAEG